jgi:phage-related protein
VSKVVEIVVNAVDKASGILGGIGRSVGNIANAAGSAVGKVGGFFRDAFAVATGGLISGALSEIQASFGKLVDGMIGGNAEFERYQTQFQVLLGSSDAAKKRLEELAKFGASTPFELPEVVKADKIIQGFGLHSEEAAKKFGFSGEQIRTIAGDVASGTGISFEEAAGYIGKFSAGATGEVISRFQELGIITREELTKLGLEFSKSGQLMSPLPQATEVVLQLMKKKYGGMMDAQSKTFEGMMSNLQDWVAGTLRQIGAPIFEVLKDKLQFLLTFLGSPQVQAGIAGFATFLATTIGKGVEMATPILEGIINTIGRLPTIITTLRSGSPVLIAQALGMSPELVTTVMGVVNQIIAAVQGVVAWFTTNWPAIQAVVGQVIAAVVAVISDPLVPIFQVVLGVAGQIVQWFQANWPAIQAVIAAGIAAVVAIINDPLAPIFRFIAEIAGQIVQWFQANWPLIQQTITTVVNAIAPVVQAALPIVKTIFETVFGAIKVVVKTVVDTVLAVVKAGMQLLNGDTKGALETLRQAFEGKFNAVVQFLRDLVPKMLALGKNIIDGIHQGMVDAGNKIKEFLIGLIKSALGKFADFLDMHSPSMLMHYYGRMIVQGLANGIRESASVAVRAAEAVARSTSEAVQGVATGSGLTGDAAVGGGERHTLNPDEGRGQTVPTGPTNNNDDAHDRAAARESGSRATRQIVRSSQRQQPIQVQLNVDGQQIAAAVHDRIAGAVASGGRRAYAQ